jgi:pre-mRNA-splicing factor ATP-dependent RNA helicase DHX15/PRP43
MRALELLNYLGALNDDGDITELGKMMADMPLDPQLGKMLIISPEFRCSQEILTIVAMLSGKLVTLSLRVVRADVHSVPNVYLRPNNARKEADIAKKQLAVPDGDHLSLLNVYNSWVQSKTLHFSSLLPCSLVVPSDGRDKNWAWENFLAARALAQADNVRAQLERNMERFELDLISIAEPTKLYKAVRMALVCGFFMQIAHKEGDKGSYLTVKDNQVVGLHPSCGLETQPEWVLFNEFVLTTRPYIRTVTEVRPEWYANVRTHDPCGRTQ